MVESVVQSALMIPPVAGALRLALGPPGGAAPQCGGKSIRSMFGVARMERSGIRVRPRGRQKDQRDTREPWIPLRSIQATGNLSVEYLPNLTGVRRPQNRGALRRMDQWP